MPNLDDDLPNVDQTTSCDLSQKLWDLRKLDYFSFTLLSGDEHEIKVGIIFFNACNKKTLINN